MARKKSDKQVTAIVPTYNEAARIRYVLDVLSTYPNFKEIIVVDDGSKDTTPEIVKEYPVKYIRNKINKGKGYVMNLGVEAAKTDIIFFVDADVRGLTHKMIDQICKPVIDGEVDMFIGMRNRKIYFLHQIMIFVPLFGGERAVTKKLWQMVPEYYKYRFRIEAGLNFYSQYYGSGFAFKVIKGLSQVIKEKKYGFWDGTKQRWSMSYNIFTAQVKLQFVNIPVSARNNRILAAFALQSILGIGIALFMYAAVYYGPTDFLYYVFEKDLARESSTPIIHLLLMLARVTSISTILIVATGLFIVNLFTFLLTFKKLPSVLAEFLYKTKRNHSEI